MQSRRRQFARKGKHGWSNETAVHGIAPNGKQMAKRFPNNEDSQLMRAT